MLTMWRISLVLLICLVAVPAYSNPPSPAPSKSTHEKKGSPKQHEQGATTDQRGTEHTPTFVKGIPSTTKEPEPTKETDPHRDYTSPEWWMVYVTIVLVGFTGGLMIYTARLWGATKALAEDAKRTATQQAADMQASLRIAKESADAARRSADATHTELLMVHRPKVRVSNIVTPFIHQEVLFQAGRTVKGFLHFTNVGETPAILNDSGCWVEWRIGDLPMWRPYEGKNATHAFESALGNTITPGDWRQLMFESEQPLPVQEAPLILQSSNNWHIWIMGWIAYRYDIGTETIRRRTYFCRIYKIPPGRFFHVDNPDYEHEE